MPFQPVFGDVLQQITTYNMWHDNIFPPANVCAIVVFYGAHADLDHVYQHHPSGEFKGVTPTLDAVAAASLTRLEARRRLEPQRHGAFR